MVGPAENALKALTDLHCSVTSPHLISLVSPPLTLYLCHLTLYL